MSYAEQFLDQVSTHVAERLRSDSRFANVKIVEKRRGVLISDIQTARGVFADEGKSNGVAVFVELPQIVNDDSEAPGARLRCDLEITVHEMPIVNMGDGGSGVTSSQWLWRIFELLRYYKNGALGANFMLTPGTPLEVNGSEPEGEVVRVLKMNCLAPPLDRAAATAPVIHAATEALHGSTWASLVTATSDEDGAAVRMTAVPDDGETMPTYPRELSDAEVAAGGTQSTDGTEGDYLTAGDWIVCAVAYVSGKLPSNAVCERITVAAAP